MVDDREAMARIIAVMEKVKTLAFARLLRATTSSDCSGYGEELLTVPEVAKVLKLTEARVYELVRRGKVDAVRIGKAVRISRSTLERLIKEGGTDGLRA